MITIVKLGPGKKEQISVNTLCEYGDQTVDGTACRVLATVCCMSHIFRKGVKKVITNEERRRVFEGC